MTWKLFPIGLVCLGVFLTLKISWDGYVAHKSKTWPTTKAIITESYYDVITTREKQDNGFYRTKTSYSIKLSYEYNVGPVKHTSTRLTSGFEEGVIDKSEADEIVNKYEFGREITIYYDPDDHEYGILVISPLSKDLFWAGFFGLLTILLSYLFFIKITN